jgi:hypothetical protein
MTHDAGDGGGELPPPAKKKSPAEEAAEKRLVPVRPPGIPKYTEVQFRNLILCFSSRMYYFAIQVFQFSFVGLAAAGL